jgi:hypothetical protein
VAEADWKSLEILVAKIQQELAPAADVSHNVRIKGQITGQLRQVDVLVRQKIGQYQMIIAIDCKDYKTAIDVKGVEEFRGLITDIGANKGALVCPSGFTRTAKKRAKGFGIDLYSPVDTDPHKWQVKPTLPVICDFRSVAIGFGIRVTAPVPFRMNQDFFRSLQVFNEREEAIGLPLDTALKRWNEGELPTEPGEHKNVPNFREPVTWVDNGYGTRVPVTLFLSLLVKQRVYFGYLPITNIRGLKDEQTGAVVTNAFTTGQLDAVEVENKWKKLEAGQEPPVRPVMQVVGLDCYDVGQI